MTGEYILVIDQGTTGTRAAVYDRNSRRMAYSYRKHRQITPRPGWVEHDPVEIWGNTVQVLREVVEKAGIDPGEIRSIGVTNQRETTVLWDRETGRPVYNAIVWQDTRTTGICEELRTRGLEEEVRRRTGLTISTYFSATKIKWILDNIPGTRELIRNHRLLFGTMDTWIIWNLTRNTGNHETPDRGGAHITDPTNASRTMLYNITKMKWDDELLGTLGIPYTMLPEVKPSSSRRPYGYTNKEILGAEIPVHGDLGDQQAALVGQTCFRPGNIKTTYGTGSFLLINTGDKPVESKHGLLTTIAYHFEGYSPAYALEGSISTTGAAIEWLIDIGLINEPHETEELAEKTRGTGSGGVFFIPAFSGLYAPYWDPYARGLFIGITRYTRREHLVHAVLEGIAWRVREIYDAMIMDSGVKPDMMRVDGGLTRNKYLLQLQANTLGVPVEKPSDIEATGLGAAYAAGLGAGLWRSTDELLGLRRVEAIYNPIWPKDKREKLYKIWKNAIKRSLNWLSEAQSIPSSFAYDA